MTSNAAPSIAPSSIADALAHAWTTGERLSNEQVPAADEAQAYAVQAAVAARLGPVGGWKVGARDDVSEPNCAPLPASGLVATGARLGLPAQSLRGVELEVAVRLGKDLPAPNGLPSREDVLAAIGEVIPAIEIVDSRMAQGRAAPAMARLADLQSHGALVLGTPSGVDPRHLAMPRVHAHLTFNGETVADMTGAHTAPDLWRLVAWLAVQAQAMGLPLRAGQVVTTGTCTGCILAPEGARVVGELAGIGRVELTL